MPILAILLIVLVVVVIVMAIRSGGKIPKDPLTILLWVVVLCLIIYLVSAVLGYSPLRVR